MVPGVPSLQEDLANPIKNETELDHAPYICMLKTLTSHWLLSVFDQLWDKWVKYVKPTKLDIVDVLGDQQCDLIYVFIFNYCYFILFIYTFLCGHFSKIVESSHKL